MGDFWVVIGHIVEASREVQPMLGSGCKELRDGGEEGCKGNLLQKELFPTFEVAGGPKGPASLKPPEPNSKGCVTVCLGEVGRFWSGG